MAYGSGKGRNDVKREVKNTGAVGGQAADKCTIERSQSRFRNIYFAAATTSQSPTGCGPKSAASPQLAAPIPL